MDSKWGVTTGFEEFEDEGSEPAGLGAGETVLQLYLI